MMGRDALDHAFLGTTLRFTESRWWEIRQVDAMPGIRVQGVYSHLPFHEPHEREWHGQGLGHGTEGSTARAL